MVDLNRSHAENIEQQEGGGFLTPADAPLGPSFPGAAD